MQFDEFKTQTVKTAKALALIDCPDDIKQTLREQLRESVRDYAEKDKGADKNRIGFYGLFLRPLWIAHKFDVNKCVVYERTRKEKESLGL